MKNFQVEEIETKNFQDFLQLANFSPPSPGLDAKFSTRMGYRRKIFKKIMFLQLTHFFIPSPGREMLKSRGIWTKDFQEFFGNSLIFTLPLLDQGPAPDYTLGSLCQSKTWGHLQ